MNLSVIGYIHTDLPDKFGVPRQSGLVRELTGYIELKPPFNQKEAFNGLEQYEYIWLLFIFHQVTAIDDSNFSATVKPPRLGGNTRMGVFSTRSPFRPNNIGLSSVKLEKIEFTENGTRLYVSGVDLIDGTPIVDIKPYLPYSDSHEGARAGFSDIVKDYQLEVLIDDELINQIPEEKRTALINVLKEDPRPGYQKEAGREYGMFFDCYNVRFVINSKELIVTSINKR